ncbi:MAG: tripartite tricarboxylate transporter substrate binding protein [Burkholderiaceae bacterium]
MPYPRLKLSVAAAAMAFIAAAPASYAADSQAWPTKPVTLIVPYSPGGGTDIIARLVGSKLSEIWHQSVIVENKPGANGVIGSAEVARSTPDGYKIMLVVGSHIINPVLTKSVPYDTEHDFTPITRLATSPLVLVVSKNGKYPDLNAFIKQGKKGDISVGYSEGQTQLTGELIKQKAGVNVIPVPYKGGSPLMVDIIGGHVESGVTSVLTALPHVKSGKLKVIGIAADKDLKVFPEAVTFKQAGYPEVESLSWYGLFGPKNMPESVVHKIREGLLQATRDPELARQLEDQGATVVIDTPADFKAFLSKEKKKWTEVARKGGIEAK